MSVTFVGAAVSSRPSDWRPLWLFLTLAILGVLGDRVHARTGRMRLSAGLTIVGLAMALLGPAPAVAICWLSRIIDALHTDGIRLRGRWLALIWNLGMYVNVLIGSLIIQAAVDAGVSRESAGFALVVVAAISFANVINFVLAAIWIRAQRRNTGRSSAPNRLPPGVALDHRANLPGWSAGRAVHPRRAGFAVAFVGAARSFRCAAGRASELSTTAR